MTFTKKARFISSEPLVQYLVSAPIAYKPLQTLKETDLFVLTVSSITALSVTDATVDEGISVNLYYKKTSCKCTV